MAMWRQAARLPRKTLARGLADAIIFGLKELPEDGTPLIHRHIMFGQRLQGPTSRPGAAETVQGRGGTLLIWNIWWTRPGAAWRPLAIGRAMPGRRSLNAGRRNSAAASRPGEGRPERGASAEPTPSFAFIRATCEIIGATVVGTMRPTRAAMGVAASATWPKPPAAGPFPGVLQHEIFPEPASLLVARPSCRRPPRPNFVRKLTVIGDDVCDPTSDFSPIKVYDQATDWDAPALR